MAKVALLMLPTLGSLHHLACPSLVCGVVKERADVVDKEREEELSYIFLVRKVKSAFERDP
ncbi:hypothetical protein IMZ48_41115 [Candidatus Bathyarchaeota archaeon]|nr:hypothetical protein [Candidatus Bathyarchaeota archaeon]